MRKRETPKSNQTGENCQVSNDSKSQDTILREPNVSLDTLTPSAKKERLRTGYIIPDTMPPDLTLTHTQLFEDVFRWLNVARAFMKKALPKKILKKIDLDRLEVDHEKFHDDLFHEHRADIVYRIPYRNEDQYIKIFVILEHKSYRDRFTIFQLARYAMRLLERDYKEAQKRKQAGKNYKLPPIYPIIIYHGEKPFDGPTELKQLYALAPGLEKYLLNIKARLFDLATMSEKDLPSDPSAPELATVLKIMKVIFSKNLGTRARSILEELKPYTDDPKYRDLARKLLVYLIRNGRHLKTAEQNDLEHVFYPHEKDVTMKTLAERIYLRGQAKGEARGEARGIAVGEARGEIQGKIAAIMKILAHRFGDIPESVKKSIMKKQDPVILDHLLVSLLSCNSLDEFVDEL